MNRNLTHQRLLTTNWLTPLPSSDTENGATVINVPSLLQKGDITQPFQDPGYKAPVAYNPLAPPNTAKATNAPSLPTGENSVVKPTPTPRQRSSTPQKSGLSPPTTANCPNTQHTQPFPQTAFKIPTKTTSYGNHTRSTNAGQICI